MPNNSRARSLSQAFLVAHRECLLEDLFTGQETAVPPDQVSIQERLYDLIVESVGSPSPGPAGVYRLLEGLSGELSALVAGQVALWERTHTMLREVSGPHREFVALHGVLATIGDVEDAFTGALIDVAASGPYPLRAASPPRWPTLVELGRQHREFRMLHRIIHDLLRTRNPDRMFAILERGILETFNIRSLAIAFVNHAEGYLEIVRSEPSDPDTGGPVGWRYDLTEPEMYCEVVRSGKIEVVDGWDPRYHVRVVEPNGRMTYQQRPPGYNAGQTAYFVPIMAGDRAIGVVATGSLEADKPIVLREFERMAPFLHQAGATLSIVSEMMGRRRAERLAELSRELQEANLRLEEANRQIQEATRLKSQFLANISHELRTPMNAIVGFTNLVLRKAGDLLPEKHRENLWKVKLSSDHLLSLINDILDLSKIEARRMTVNPRKFSVREMIQSCCAASTPLQKPEVELTYDVPDEVGEATTDEPRVRQIVVNLLSNALKFTEQGEVRVSVNRVPGTVDRQKNSDEPRITVPGPRGGDGLLVVAVSDTGIGIPPEAMAYIFEEFRQVEGNHQEQKGTGLGLSITRKLVDLLGGTIRVQSEPGKGSTFTVTIPAVMPPGG